MRRSGRLLVPVFLIATIGGCDSGGLKEGPPPEPIKSAQTPEYKNYMEKAAGKMKMKNAPPGSGSGTKGDSP